jgi:hypothetical protein
MLHRISSAEQQRVLNFGSKDRFRALPPSKALQGAVFLASLSLSGYAISQTARVTFDESVAVYGPEIFPALRRIQFCGDFRVLVAYINGTDLLFVDEVILAEGDSTFSVVGSYSFVEFNAYETSRFVTDVSCRHRDAETLEITGNGNDGHRNADFEFTLSLNTSTGDYTYSDSLGLSNP